MKVGPEIQVKRMPAEFYMLQEELARRNALRLIQEHYTGLLGVSSPTHCTCASLSHSKALWMAHWSVGML